MHEFSIARSLLSRVDELAVEHEALAVRGIRVRLGELSGVEAELLATAYGLLSEGTKYSETKLEIVPEAVAWRCTECDREIERDGELRCSRCAAPARLAAGGELLLEGLDMEVA